MSIKILEIDEREVLIKREQEKAKEVLEHFTKRFLKRIEEYIKSGAIDTEQLKTDDDYVFVNVAFCIY